MSFGNSSASAGRSLRQKANRLRDLLRFRYPLKFDFSRMTIDELTGTVERAMKRDVRQPSQYKPMVAIGHSKDSIDAPTINTFLSYLKSRDIKVATFDSAWLKLLRGSAAEAPPS